MRINSMSDAVKIVIDGYSAGHLFHGNELKDDVVKIYPESQYQYVDTILRMARRHRRYAFCVVNQNNSLYKKLAIKSIVEQIKEAAPKETPPAIQSVPVISHGPMKQGELPFFNQPFFAVFLLVFFVALLPVFFVTGRPLIPPSFIASRSASLYTPTGPIYLNGWIPFLWSRLLTPSDEMPKICDISNAVIASIYKIIPLFSAVDQGKNDKMFRNRNSGKVCHFDPPYCVKMTQYRNTGTYKKNKKTFPRTLTIHTGGGILYICSSVPILEQINKRKPEAPEAESPIEGEGEFYERRTEKFSGMA